MKTEARPLGLHDPLEAWRRQLSGGDRKTIATLLSLTESSRADHRSLVEDVLSGLPVRGKPRIGLTGVPGAGKSCLIEALGAHLLDQGKSVAALTVDPSSQVTGGSILGDKLRMPRLGSDKRAFVRGFSSQGLHGGLAPGIQQAVSLFDRANYDVIFIETVGVGQSEVEIAGFVDCLVMVLSPTAGDDIQGIKRGITEHVDLIVVNKCDAEPELAEGTASRYSNALGLMRGSATKAIVASALSGQGVFNLWSSIEEFCAERLSRGEAKGGRVPERRANIAGSKLARRACGKKGDRKSEGSHRKR